jgi:hypothetical protein
VALSAYWAEDPTLAQVVDEADSDVLVRGLDGLSVRDCLRDDHRELPVVDLDATALKTASSMASSRTPLAANVDKKQHVLGAVTLDGPPDRMVGA